MGGELAERAGLSVLEMKCCLRVGGRRERADSEEVMQRYREIKLSLSDRDLERGVLQPLTPLLFFTRKAKDTFLQQR